MKTLVSRFLTEWYACRITSDKKSAQYGIRFSSPLYILITTAGILMQNPYILFISALIAVLGIILPMHPFDYIYNYVVTKLTRSDKFPGRGTELPVSSSISLLLTIGVITLIFYELPINYSVMAFIYVLSSVFFIGVQLFWSDIPSRRR